MIKWTPNEYRKEVGWEQWFEGKGNNRVYFFLRIPGIVNSLSTVICGYGFECANFTDTSEYSSTTSVGKGLRRHMVSLSCNEVEANMITVEYSTSLCVAQCLKCDIHSEIYKYSNDNCSALCSVQMRIVVYSRQWKHAHEPSWYFSELIIPNVICICIFDVNKYPLD